jgi:menaquinone-dependent protoporphyrinogen oxidase
MKKGDKAIEQFNNAFPEDIRQHAIATACLGGEFLFEKMNFFQKAIVKKVENIKESKSELDEKEMQHFVEKLKGVL